MQPNGRCRETESLTRKKMLLPVCQSIALHQHRWCFSVGHLSVACLCNSSNHFYHRHQQQQPTRKRRPHLHTAETSLCLSKIIKKCLPPLLFLFYYHNLCLYVFSPHACPTTVHAQLLPFLSLVPLFGIEQQSVWFNYLIISFIRSPWRIKICHQVCFFLIAL